MFKSSCLRWLASRLIRAAVSLATSPILSLANYDRLKVVIVEAVYVACVQRAGQLLDNALRGHLRIRCTDLEQGLMICVTWVQHVRLDRAP